MRGRRVILYLADWFAVPNGDGDWQARNQDRSLTLARSIVHEPLIRQEWSDDPQATAAQWLAVGTLPLYVPRQNYSEAELRKALWLWACEQWSQHEGWSSAASGPDLDEVGVCVGAARTLFIDIDGQAWDLSEDRLFTCPQRVYWDLYRGDALDQAYSMPLSPAELEFLDWEVLLGGHPLRRLREYLGEADAHRKTRINEGLIDQFVKRAWQRDDDRTASSWTTGETITMGSNLWEALRLKVLGDEQVCDDVPPLTSVMVISGLLAFCFHELLDDVHSPQACYVCSVCGWLERLGPRQHRDRICDSCRNLIRHRKVREYVARHRAASQALELK